MAIILIAGFTTPSVLVLTTFNLQICLPECGSSSNRWQAGQQSGSAVVFPHKLSLPFS